MKDIVTMISLDTSSVSTGWAVWINGKLDVHGVINIKNIKDDKHAIMTNKIWALLENYQPDIVVVEETSVTTNAVTQRMLTQITGTVYTWAIIHGKEYHALRPSQWRSKVKPSDMVIPRKRKEQKQWSVNRAKELLGVEVNDDEADALLIGKAYMSYFGISI